MHVCVLVVCPRAVLGRAIKAMLAKESLKVVANSLIQKKYSNTNALFQLYVIRDASLNLPHWTRVFQIELDILNTIQQTLSAVIYGSSYGMVFILQVTLIAIFQQL